MRFLGFLMVAFLLGVACSSGQVDTVPQPSVDIGATVDAAVEATRLAERESWTPGPTATLVPTPTPMPTATLIPTPEPYVASPGSVEAGTERISRCLRENEGYRELSVEILVASRDVTREEAEAYVTLMANEEFLKLAIVGAAEDDPQLVHMVSLWGEISDEVCSSEFRSSGSERRGPAASGDAGLANGNVAELAGDLYDCLQMDEEFGHAFWEYAEGWGNPALVESLRSDRQLFIDLMVLAAVSEGFEFSEFRSGLEENCSG